MNPLQLVLKQMRQRALSTWLTMLSVIFGAALAVSVMILQRESGALFAGKEFGYDILVGAKGSPTQLVLNTAYHIDKSPGNIPYTVLEALRSRPDMVERAVPFMVGDTYKGYRVVGTTPGMFGFEEYVTTGDGLMAVPDAPEGTKASSLPQPPAPKPLAGYDAQGRLLSGYQSANVPEEERDANKKVAAKVFEQRRNQKFTFAQGTAFHPESFQAVIGAEVAEKTGLKLGSTLKVAHDAPAGGATERDEHDEVWTVVGILDRTQTPEDKVVFVPLISTYAIPAHEKAMDMMTAMQRGEDLARFAKDRPVSEGLAGGTTKPTTVPATGPTSKPASKHDHDHDDDHKKPATPAPATGATPAVKHDHDHDDDHKKPAAPTPATGAAPAAKHDHDHDDDHKKPATPTPPAGAAPAAKPDHDHDADHPKPAPVTPAAGTTPVAGTAPAAKHDHDHDDDHKKPATPTPAAAGTAPAAKHDHDHDEKPAAAGAKESAKADAHDHHDHEEAYEMRVDGTIRLLLPKDRWLLSGVMVQSVGARRHFTRSNDLIQYAFANSPVATAVSPGTVMRQFFTVFLSPTTIVLLYVAVLVAITAAISILVSIYNSVSARGREIAIMRALGATRKTILFLICFEAGLIGLMGGLIGMVIGHGLGAVESAFFNKMLGVGINWLTPSWQEWVYLGGIVALSVVAGLVPGLKAYRTPVATNLVSG